MKTNHRHKGSPITSTPTIRRYRNGEYTVWKDSIGKVHKRKTGHRNATDANVSKTKKNKRKRGFVNTTDGSRRASYNM